MKNHPFRRLGVAALAVIVISACSSSTAAAGTNWSAQTSANAAGGLQALISAARAEGQLNLIGFPRDWANYGSIIDSFQVLYGIHVNSANPNGSGKDEIDAAKKGKSSHAPDVLDLGMDVAVASADLFAPYQVTNWSDIPPPQKEATGLWYEDYGGYMAIGYDSGKLPSIATVDDLLLPAFRGKVALYGDPTVSTEALSGVMMASLARGGSLDNIGPGVDFFHKLKLAGNFLSVQPTTNSIKGGQTPVVIDWDYYSQQNFKNVPTWQVLVPANATLGGFFAQAINKSAPHPAAARLWEEYLTPMWARTC